METKKEPEVAKKQALNEDEEMIIEASEDLEVVKTFEDMGLRDELLRGNFLKLIFLRHFCLWFQ